MGAKLLAFNIILGVLLLTGTLPKTSGLYEDLLDAHSDAHTDDFSFTPDESDINSDSWRPKSDFRENEGDPNGGSLREDLQRAEENDNVDHEVDHGERPIKEIKDRIESENDDADNSHNQKEQQKLKISKLILSGKKNEDGAHNPFSSKKEENPTEKPTEKPNNQAWSNGIVTSDGGLLFSQQNSKPTINEEQSKEKTDSTNDRNLEVENTEKQEQQRASEEEVDRQIMQIPRFQELRKHFIARYLADHYKEQQPSHKLLGQISDLITNDLREQWKKWLKNGQIHPDGTPRQSEPDNSDGMQDLAKKDEVESSSTDSNSHEGEQESRKEEPQTGSPKIDGEKKPEKRLSAKSILSNMMRSSHLSPQKNDTPQNDGHQSDDDDHHHEKDLASGDKDANDVSDIFAGEGFDNTEINLDDLKKSKPVKKEVPEKKMYKKGDDYNLSIMSNPDPKINKLVKVPMFNQLRKQQIDSYLDAQFGDEPFTEEDLRKVDHIISENMIKDLHTENSGLLAWLQDGRSEEEKEEEEEEERRKREQKVLEENKEKDEESKRVEVNDKSDEESKSESEGNVDSGLGGILNGAADVIKSKRNSWMKILSTGQQNSSQSEGEKSSEEPLSERSGDMHGEGGEGDERDERDGEREKSVEGEGQGSDGQTEEKEDDNKGVLDSIWGFFSGSSGDDDKIEENVKEEGKVEEVENKVDERKSEDEEEDSQLPVPTKIVEDDGGSGIEAKIASAEEEKDTPNPTAETRDSEPVQSTTTPNSEIKQDLKDDVEGSSATNQEETTAEHIPDTDDIQPRSDSSDNVSSESVDVEHEKSKYKALEQEQNVSSEEADETDPLKKLCKKYPTLKACQSSSVPKPGSDPLKDETRPKLDSSFASYIKYFTRSINNIIYGIFSYAVGCVKSLVQILCTYTVGIFLNLVGRQDVSLSMNIMFDTISTEYFALIIIVLVNHFGFFCYYKHSTMHPIIKTNDNLNELDTKQMKGLQNQVNVMKEKMALVQAEKDKFQKKVDKEMEVNQELHNENKGLKVVIEQSKGDKKRIKDLEKSIKDHENRMKGKDNELEKLSITIETVKNDMKNERGNLKELEEKHRYVTKELDSKDQNLYDLEENRKEMLKDISSKEKEIAEKTGMLSELSEKISILQVKQLDLEEKINSERKVGENLESEKKALQETLLNIDKLNYEGKLENGWNDNERIEDEDGVLNVTMNDDMKAERLQNIINAIKLKAEHFEAVNELVTCRTDLDNYRKKSDGLEENLNELSSKFDTLSSECEDLRKCTEKKDIELQTITKFFGERESEYQKQNVSQKNELQQLSKDMASINEEKREMSDLLKKIESLKEEIATNDKDYKQQIATLEEQNHNNYLKMRTALRECDEHKREKEVYRKRLLDIDLSPQAVQPKVVNMTKNDFKDRSESPGSDKSHERLSDHGKLPSPSEPKQPSVPQMPRQASVPQMQQMPRQASMHTMPPMFPGMGGLPPNPMAPGLYRGPPGPMAPGPYRMPPMPRMPPRPPFMPRMRPAMPLGQNMPP